MIKKIFFVVLLGMSSCYALDFDNKNCPNGICPIPKEVVVQKDRKVADSVDLNNPEQKPNKSQEVRVVIEHDYSGQPVNNKISFFDSFLSNPNFGYLMILVIIGLYKYLCKKYNIDPNQFEGLIMHCFNEIESLGILKGWDGNQKLTEAMAKFNDQFQISFKRLPTDKEKLLAKYSFARNSYNAKFVNNSAKVLNEKQS